MAGAVGALVAAAAVVWVAWPLPRVAAHAVVDPMRLGVPGGLWGRVDLDLVVWILAWVAHALATDPARLFQANIFHPAPDTLASSEHLLGLAPIAAPVYLATGNAVLAHNVTALAVVWIAAVGCFALARAWTGDAAAGVLAAAAFALAPANVQGFTRLHVSAVHLIPVVLLLAWRAARTPRAATLALLAGAVALQALAGFYVAYALAAALVAFAPALACEARRATGRVRGVALAAAIGFACAAATGLPYLRARAAGVVGTDVAAALAVPPADVARLVVASLGWPVAVLAAVGLVAGGAPRAVRLGLALVAGLGALLACGPTIPLPGGGALPGPWALAAALVPGFASLRAPTRFLVLPALAGACLAATAAAAAVRAAGRRRGPTAGWTARAAVVAAAAALVAVRAPAGGLPTTRLALDDPAWAADRWLAAHGGGRPALVLPLHLSGLEGPALLATGRALVGSTLHWAPLVNGYSGWVPPGYALLATIARRLPERASFDDLCALVDLGWIVVHWSALGAAAKAAWDAGAGALPLRRAWTDGGSTVWEVTARCGAREPALRAVLAGGHPATTLGGVPLAPLPAGARRAAVTGAPPREAAAGLWATFGVRVTNAGDAPWPGLAVHPEGAVVLTVRWLDAASGRVALEAAPVRLARDLAPGATLETPVGTPVPPPGDYVLEVAVAQVGHGVFPPAAAPPLRAPVRSRPWRRT